MIINRGAPRRFRRLIKKTRCIGRQPIPIRPEMIIDDVKKYHHSEAVRFIDQGP